MDQLLNNNINRKKILKVVVPIVVFVFLALCVFPPNAVMNLLPFYQEKMVEDTVKWCRLADFPEQIMEFDIVAGGSVFSRQYEGSFKASKEILEEWADNSPGLQEAEKEELSGGVIKYVITPGGGAQYAEVVIDFESGQVIFKAYWS